MNFLFAVFLSTALLILFAIHFFLFMSSVRFLGIKTPGTKKALIILSFFLSFSFMLSSALVHAFDFFLIRWFYLAIAVWHGALVYFLSAALLTWLVFFVLKSIGKTKLIINFFVGFLGLAILISIYAIINGQRLITNVITVDLPELPKYWQDKTAVLLSDVHLGAVHNGNYLQKIIDKVNEIKPDIIFITGDYFDGTYHRHEELIEPLKNLNAPEGIYYVRGNHETYIGAKEKIMAIGNYATVLNNETRNINGLNVIGIDYPSRTQDFSMENILSDLEIFSPNILLFHEPKDTEAAKKAGIDLQLSGHTHLGQLWPFNYATYLIYGKYHYGLHHDDGYSIYTSNGAGTWGPPMRLFKPSEIVQITLK